MTEPVVVAFTATLDGSNIIASADKIEKAVEKVDVKVTHLQKMLDGLAATELLVKVNTTQFTAIENSLLGVTALIDKLNKNEVVVKVDSRSFSGLTDSITALGNQIKTLGDGFGKTMAEGAKQGTSAVTEEQKRLTDTLRTENAIRQIEANRNAKISIDIARATAKEVARVQKESTSSSNTSTPFNLDSAKALIEVKQYFTQLKAATLTGNTELQNSLTSLSEQSQTRVKDANKLELELHRQTLILEYTDQQAHTRRMIEQYQLQAQGRVASAKEKSKEVSTIAIVGSIDTSEALAKYKSYLTARNAADKHGNDELAISYQASANVIRNSQLSAIQAVTAAVNAEITTLHSLRDAQIASNAIHSTNSQSAINQINREIELLERRNVAAQRQVSGFNIATQRADSNQQLSRDLPAGNSAQTSVISELTNGLNKLQQTLMLVGVAMSGRQIMEYADQWTHFTNAIQLASEKTGNAEMQQARLFRLAQDSRAPLESVTQLYLRLSRASESLNLSQSQTNVMIGTVTKALALMGTAPSAVRGGLLQLEQALGGVVVRGQEFKSILDSMPSVMAIVVKHYDEAAKAIAREEAVMRGATDTELQAIDARKKTVSSIADLRNRMYEGKVGSEEFARAILLGQKEIDFAFDRSHKTFAQAFTALDNGFTKLVGGFNEGTHASDLFFSGMTALSEHLPLMLGVLTAIGGAFAFIAIQAALAARAQAVSTGLATPGHPLVKLAAAAATVVAVNSLLSPTDKQEKEGELAKLEKQIEDANNRNNQAKVKQLLEVKDKLAKEVNDLAMKKLNDDESALKKQLAAYETAISTGAVKSGRGGVVSNNVLSEKDAQAAHLGGRDKSDVLSDLKQIEEQKATMHLNELARIEQLKLESVTTKKERQSESALKSAEFVTSKAISDAKEFNELTQKAVDIRKKYNDLLDAAINNPNLDKSTQDKIKAIPNIEEQRLSFEKLNPEISNTLKNAAAIVVETKISSELRKASESNLKNLKESQQATNDSWTQSLEAQYIKMTNSVEIASAKNPIKLSFEMDSSKVAKKVAELQPLIEQASKKYNFPASVVASIINHESAGENIHTKMIPPPGKVYTAGGIGQITDATVSAWGMKNKYDKSETIDVITRELAKLEQKYGSMEKAIAAYAQGEAGMKKGLGFDYAKARLTEIGASNVQNIEANKNAVAYLEKELEIKGMIAERDKVLAAGDDIKAVSLGKHIDIEIRNLSVIKSQFVAEQSLNKETQDRLHAEMKGVMAIDKLHEKYSGVGENINQRSSFDDSLRAMTVNKGATSALADLQRALDAKIAEGNTIAPKTADAKKALDLQELKAITDTEEGRLEHKNKLVELQQEYNLLLKSENRISKEINDTLRVTDQVKNKQQDAIIKASDYVTNTMGYKSPSRAGQLFAVQQDIRKQRDDVGIIPDKDKMDKFNSDMDIQLKDRTLKVNIEFDKANMQTAMTEMTAASKTLADSFGSVGKSIGDMGTSLMAMLDATIQNANASKVEEESYTAQRELVLAKKDNSVELAELDKSHAAEKSKLDKKSAMETIDGMANIAGAASQMFAKQSAGRKALHAVEMTLHIAGLAMKIVDIATNIPLTISNMAAGAAKFFAQSGWAGFAGVAAMAAVMAGLGFAMMGGGSKSTQDSTDAASSEKGTILGSPDSTSSSINNMIKMLADIHATEYPELKATADAMRSLGGSVTTMVTKLAISTQSFTNMASVGTFTKPDVAGSSNSVGTSAITSSLSLMLGVGGLIGGLIFGIGKLFGIGKTKITQLGEGLVVSFSDFFGQGMEQAMTAQTWAKWEIKTKGWFSSSTKIVQSFGAISSELSHSLLGVFTSLRDVMLSLSSGLGISELLKSRMEDYTPSTLRVDWKAAQRKDKSLDIGQYLSDQISAYTDRIATDIFGSLLGSFQKMGEGMLETVGRLATEIGVVNAIFRKNHIELGLTGMGMIQFSDTLINLFDSTGTAKDGLKNFITTMNDFYDATNTTLEKTQDSIKNFYSISDQYDVESTTNIKDVTLTGIKDALTTVLADSKESTTKSGDFGKAFPYAEAYFKAQGRFNVDPAASTQYARFSKSFKSPGSLADISGTQYDSSLDTTFRENDWLARIAKYTSVSDQLAKNTKQDSSALKDASAATIALVKSFGSFAKFTAAKDAAGEKVTETAKEVAGISGVTTSLKTLTDFQKTLRDTEESFLKVNTSADATAERLSLVLGTTLDKTAQNMFSISQLAFDKLSQSGAEAVPTAGSIKTAIQETIIAASNKVNSSTMVTQKDNFLAKDSDKVATASILGVSSTMASLVAVSYKQIDAAIATQQTVLGTAITASTKADKAITTATNNLSRYPTSKGYQTKLDTAITTGQTAKSNVTTETDKLTGLQNQSKDIRASNFDNVDLSKLTPTQETQVRSEFKVSGTEYDAIWEQIKKGGSDTVNFFTQLSLTLSINEQARLKATIEYTAKTNLAYDSLLTSEGTLTTEGAKRNLTNLEAIRVMQIVNNEDAAHVTNLIKQQAATEKVMFITDKTASALALFNSKATPAEKAANDLALALKAVDDKFKDSATVTKHMTDSIKKDITDTFNAETFAKASAALRDFKNTLSNWAVDRQITQEGSTKSQLDTAIGKFSYQAAKIVDATYSTKGIIDPTAKTNVDTYITRTNTANAGKTDAEIKYALLSSITSTADQAITAIKNFYGSSKQGADLIQNIMDSVAVIPSMDDPSINVQEKMRLLLETIKVNTNSLSSVDKNTLDIKNGTDTSNVTATSQLSELTKANTTNTSMALTAGQMAELAKEIASVVVAPITNNTSTSTSYNAGDVNTSTYNGVTIDFSSIMTPLIDKVRDSNGYLSSIQNNTGATNTALGALNTLLENIKLTGGTGGGTITGGGTTAGGGGVVTPPVVTPPVVLTEEEKAMKLSQDKLKVALAAASSTDVLSVFKNTAKGVADPKAMWGGAAVETTTPSAFAGDSFKFLNSAFLNKTTANLSKGLVDAEMLSTKNQIASMGKELAIALAAQSKANIDLNAAQTSPSKGTAAATSAIKKATAARELSDSTVVNIDAEIEKYTTVRTAAITTRDALNQDTVDLYAKNRNVSEYKEGQNKLAPYDAGIANLTAQIAKLQTSKIAEIATNQIKVTAENLAISNLAAVNVKAAAAVADKIFQDQRVSDIKATITSLGAQNQVLQAKQIETNAAYNIEKEAFETEKVKFEAMYSNRYAKVTDAELKLKAQMIDSFTKQDLLTEKINTLNGLEAIKQTVSNRLDLVGVSTDVANTAMVDASLSQTKTGATKDIATSDYSIKLAELNVDIKTLTDALALQTKYAIALQKAQSEVNIAEKANDLKPTTTTERTLATKKAAFDKAEVTNDAQIELVSSLNDYVTASKITVAESAAAMKVAILADSKALQEIAAINTTLSSNKVLSKSLTASLTTATNGANSAATAALTAQTSVDKVSADIILSQASSQGNSAVMMSSMVDVSTLSSDSLKTYAGTYSNKSSYDIGRASQDELQSLLRSAAPYRFFADGGAFTNGVVSKPTSFNMGLMGESGSEAIMPLTNVNGKLGVHVVQSANDSNMNSDEELAELKRQNQILQAQNAILQEGFKQLIAVNRVQNDNLEDINSTTRKQVNN